MRQREKENEKEMRERKEREREGGGAYLGRAQSRRGARVQARRESPGAGISCEVKAEAEEF